MSFTENYYLRLVTRFGLLLIPLLLFYFVCRHLFTPCEYILIEMVASNDIVANVIFLIEGTAINGAYMPEMRNNYIIPTLEYFSLQGTVDERDMFPVECSKFVYGVVMYKTAQSIPGVTCTTYGPFSNPQRVLNVFDKLE